MLDQILTEQNCRYIGWAVCLYVGLLGPYLADHLGWPLALGLLAPLIFHLAFVQTQHVYLASTEGYDRGVAAIKEIVKKHHGIDW